MQILQTDRVVIVGAGLAALYAALKLAPRRVLMISPDELGFGASSAWAQGGVAAAMDRSDSPEAHAADTVSAGAGTVVPEVAEFVTKAARDHILDLTEIGTSFDRTKDGGYVLSREAAHSAARVVRVLGDQAGAEIMRALIHEVEQTPSIQVLEGVVALSLEVSEGQVSGVKLAHSDGSEPVLLRGAGCLLAGGGSGGLYARTTNPTRIRGQVIGMAARAGAVIADAEFVQFHPTAIDVDEDPLPLATEALRGEGAILINKDGERFMQAAHPDAELAPRDIVAREIYKQSQAGKEPMLDTRSALGDAINDQFPSVVASCMRHGIDPTQSPIPVAAAAHYHMGGIACDLNGRTSLPGLWVCGEAASTGLHGANRLASNGLLEALVFARSCALDIDSCLVGEASGARVHPEFSQSSDTTPQEAIDALRKTMTDCVGVVRDEDGIEDALFMIAFLEDNHGHDEGFANMCATATMIAAAALARCESRGAHFRSDFPDANAGDGQRSVMTYETARSIRDAIVKDVL